MQMLGLIGKNAARAAEKGAFDSGVSLLVITRDTDLCARIREIVSAWKWTTHQQTQLFQRSDSGHLIASDFPIVVYDGESTEGNWKEALLMLKAAESHPCILLASRVFDPYLWNEVIRCGGFDVIAKSAGREQLTRTLRFAWLWKMRSQDLWQ